MDSRVNILKAAFDHQRGEGFDFPVYQGRVQYGHGFNFPVFQGRAQYGAGFGDVLRRIWRFFRPVAIKGAQTLLKAGSEAIKDGATVKEVLSSTLKPTIGAVLGATAEQVENRFTSDNGRSLPWSSNGRAKRCGCWHPRTANKGGAKGNLLRNIRKRNNQ